MKFKSLLKGLVCGILGFTGIVEGDAQVVPTVVAYSDTVICGGNPAILHADATGFQIAWGTVISDFTSGSFLSDDQFYDQIVAIGFPFVF